MSLAEQLQEKRRTLRRVLDKLEITDKQRALLIAIDNSRPDDTLEEIGARVNPPMSGPATRQMLYRIREQYHKHKRFANFYEYTMQSLKRKNAKLE